MTLAARCAAIERTCQKNKWNAKGQVCPEALRTTPTFESGSDFLLGQAIVDPTKDRRQPRTPLRPQTVISSKWFAMLSEKLPIFFLRRDRDTTPVIIRCYSGRQYPSGGQLRGRSSCSQGLVRRQRGLPKALSQLRPRLLLIPDIHRGSRCMIGSHAPPPLGPLRSCPARWPQSALAKPVPSRGQSQQNLRRLRTHNPRGK